MRVLKRIPSDAETPLDQRRCDALLGIIHSFVPGSNGQATTSSPYVVVAHVPLAALVEDSGEESTLVGELEHHGLIDAETVQRIAATPPLLWPSTTSSGTPCTRAGPRGSRATPSAERSCGAIGTVDFRVAPT